MNIKIDTLGVQSEIGYEVLLAESQDSMLFHSLKYRNFLRSILADAEDVYLLAYLNDELCAALPFFIKRGSLGSVVNSLPFYGSHGGIVARQGTPKLVIDELVGRFYEFCNEMRALTSTLVEGVFAKSNDFSNYPVSYIESRIGQITHLPSVTDESEIEDALFSIFHQKTRNAIRKGLKSGFAISCERGSSVMESLQAIHKANVESIGGLPKNHDVFRSIYENFDYNADYRVYVARNASGVVVAALLVFYFKDWVEYFTPAIVKEFRSQQPLSALIFTAMSDAIAERNSKLWNWGGTWISQEGVYRFKSRWGAEDYPYRYYIRDYWPEVGLSNSSPKTLLCEYQYFYTIPFSTLKSQL